jgi:uncharacterized membrane protein
MTDQPNPVEPTQQAAISSQQAPQENMEPVAYRREELLSLYVGPLPSPDVLRQYEQLHPGVTKTIFELHSQRATHRMHLEKVVIEGENRRAYIAQIVAGLLSLTGFVTAGYFAHLHHPVEGATIATGVIVGLATAFLTGTSSRRKERTEKAQIMAGQPPDKPKRH